MIWKEAHEFENNLDGTLGDLKALIDSLVLFHEPTAKYFLRGWASGRVTLTVEVAE